jgi:hypothetical protein
MVGGIEQISIDDVSGLIVARPAASRPQGDYRAAHCLDSVMLENRFEWAKPK